MGFKLGESIGKDLQLKSAGDIAKGVMQTLSGRENDYELYYKIIGFKGIKDGLGTSTLVANVAAVLASRGLRVCVVDTSMLNPTQDVLLGGKQSDNDWGDIDADKSVVHTCEVSGVHILSFKRRTLIDLLSTFDTEELAVEAVHQLVPLYNVMLVDLCCETTQVGMRMLQLCNTVVQVWNDSYAVLRNLDGFISYMADQCCTLDKMRYVVTSMTSRGLGLNWEVLMKQYRVHHLGDIPLSEDICKDLACGKRLALEFSPCSDVKAYREVAKAVADHILSTDADKGKKSSEEDKASSEMVEKGGELNA